MLKCLCMSGNPPANQFPASPQLFAAEGGWSQKKQDKKVKAVKCQSFCLTNGV